MRTVFQEQLGALATRMPEMCGSAGMAMQRATQALLQADLGLAEQVIHRPSADRGDERPGRRNRR